MRDATNGQPVQQPPSGGIGPDQVWPFVADLVAGRREACAARVTALIARPVSPRAIYVALFQAALYEIGRRWESGAVSVAQEHVATAIVEELLADVFEHASLTARNGRSAVLACTADEYHQVGGRIVADSLEASGWDVEFLGASTDIALLRRVVAERSPDFVGLSVSIPVHLPRAFEALAAVRDVAPRVPVVLGGQAFAPGGRETLVGLSGARVVSSLDALDRFVADLA